MNISILTDYLKVAAHIVTILGLPLAIFLYYQEKKKERRDREYGTYNALDDKYIQFLELCIEHADLDVFDVPLEDRNKSSPKQRRQEQILFTILISILERAFLMYKDQSSEIKKRQWTGWVDYMRDYCSRENFRREWKKLGEQFDTEFVGLMNRLIAEAKAGSSGQQEDAADD